jgi:hypothetical protein
MLTSVLSTRGLRDNLLAVYSRIQPSFQVENGCLDPFLLTLARLALAVKVPDRLCEKLGDVWIVDLQVVPYRVTADLYIY